MGKLESWQKIVIIGLLVLFCFIVFQFISKNPFSSFVSDNDVEVSSNNFFPVVWNYLVITGLGQQLFITFAFLILIAVFVLGFYKLFEWFSNRSNDVLDNPRIPVHTKAAMNVFFKEFFIDSRVRYLRDFLVSDVTLKVFSTRSWANKRTGDRYLLIDFFISEGLDAGCNVAIIRVDRGEDYIKENIRERFIHGVSLNLANLQLKEFPMDTDSSAISQLIQLRAEANWDGDVDMVHLADQLIANTKSAAAKNADSGSNEDVENPSMGAAFQHQVNDQSSQSESDVVSPEDKYRQNNKLQ